MIDIAYIGVPKIIAMTIGSVIVICYDPKK